MCDGSTAVNDIISIIRVQCEPTNITVVQVYAPTSSSEEEDIKAFYETVQSVIDQTPSGDSLYSIGDWNAKVGKDISNGITSNFGLGERNERGYQLVEFYSRNDLRIMNTFFKLHPRRPYIWKSPDKITRNKIDYILCKTRLKSSIKRITILHGAYCGTDHNLLIADIKIKLKRIQRSKQIAIYDVEKMGLDYGIKYRFNDLTKKDRESEELWNDIRNILKETAYKNVPKVKRKFLNGYRRKLYKLHKSERKCAVIENMKNIES